MRTEQPAPVSGLPPVIKPPGPTSHDAVQIARRALHQRQIGHTGTLDPAASGLLALCLGAYTKLVPYLVESDKTYRGCIALGVETTTDDSEGEPTLIGDASGATLERVRAAAARFTGEIAQIPPRYSAIKVAGKRLYEYARANQPVEIGPRRITVHSFDVSGVEDAPISPVMLARAQAGPHANALRQTNGHIRQVAFTSRVSSGAYVRALARDLGRELGCGGYLLSLSRDAIGKLQIAQAMPLDLLQTYPERMCDHLMRGAAVLDSARFPVVTLIRGFTRRLMGGQTLTDRMMENAGEAANLAHGTLCAIAGDDGALLAMAEAGRIGAQGRPETSDALPRTVFRSVRIFPGGLR